MDFTLFATPLGRMGLAAEGGALVRLYLPGDPTPPIAPHETPLLCAARGQLAEYLGGTRKTFALPLSPAGTPFRLAVWRALGEIPYGTAISYGELARRVGRPNAARAVGGSNHANPLPIFIPCHRVIAADGTLGGYGGGLPLKRALLLLESTHLKGVSL